MSGRPLHYKIDFDVDMKSLHFHGYEIIEIVDLITDKIILNSADLKINSVFLGSKKLKFKLDRKKEELVILLGKKMKDGIMLKINFEAPLQETLAGFYRSKYRGRNDAKGVDTSKYIATTQFEPADARRAFPCFDEPAMKATFDISITADKGLKAISNMPVEKEIATGEKIKFIFQTTPKMSTYLIYLGIGDFEIAKDRAEGTEIRFITTPGKSRHGRFAIDCTKKILKYYNDYFGIKYPLPKIDLIAVPDFSSGAMENWGAITFREVELLFDKKENSSARKQRIVEIIAHELAHQWFGNLVTMKWWNDLWLNESFASWMSYKVADKLHPEWQMWAHFLDSMMSDALYLDGLKSSHPIEANVKKLHELNEIFDAISYDKGASVLRMLENHMGEEAFREGIVKYMQDNKYANAETSDLWKALSAAMDVEKIMDSWIKTTGYPLITAEKKGSKIILTQQRFLYLGSGPAKWMVPIKIHSDVKDVSVIMDKPRLEVDIGKEPEYFVVNASRSGFYRVSYDSLDEIKNNIEKISAFDRWGIQNDLYAFARSGKIGFEEYLDLIKSYKDEQDDLVCRDVSAHLYRAYTLLDGETKEKTRGVAIDFYKKIIERIGFYPKDKENENTAVLRASVLQAMGRMNDEYTLSEAGKRFATGKNIHPDMRSTVYTLVAWKGNAEIYQTLLDLFKKADVPEEKRRLMLALASFSSAEILKKTLGLAFSEHVRSQDMPLLVMRASDGPGMPLVWAWTKKNWKELQKRYGKGGNLKLLERFVGCFAAVPDAKTRKEIATFFRPYPHVRKALNEVLESVDINIKFKQGNG